MTSPNLTPTIEQLRDRLKEIEAEREYLVLALGALDALEKIAEKADDDAGKVTWLDGEIHANLNDRKDLSEYKQAPWSLKPPTFGEMFARVGWTTGMTRRLAQVKENQIRANMVLLSGWIQETALPRDDTKPMVMHEGADGSEPIEPLLDEPKPASRKRRFRRD